LLFVESIVTHAIELLLDHSLMSNMHNRDVYTLNMRGVCWKSYINY